MATFSPFPGAGGGITGDHPALGNPSDSTGLADYLEATNRPYETAPQVHTTLGSEIYIGDWSGLGGTNPPSDTSGDGTIDDPFATIAKALQLVGIANEPLVELFLAPDVLAMPEVLAGVNNVTFKGHKVQTGGTYTIQAGGVFQADEELIEIDALGAPAELGTDTFRGFLYEWGGGAPVAGQKGWVRKSAAGGGPGLTNYKLSQDKQSSLGVPVPTDSIARQALGSSVRMSVGSLIIGCSNLTFLNCTIDDGGTASRLKIIDSDQVTFLETRLDPEYLEVGSGAFVVLDNAFLAAVGDGNLGQLTVHAGGTLVTARGTVIDAGLRGGFNTFVTFAAGSWILNTANCAWTELGVLGIVSDGAGYGLPPAAFMDVHHVWSFLDCAAAIREGSFTQGPGRGGQLPNLQGEITTAHAVVVFGGATGFGMGAVYRLGDGSSSLRTSSGAGVINSVSVDGGATAGAQDDFGTLILLGTPAATGLAPALFTRFGFTVSGTDTAGITAHQVGSVFVAVLSAQTVDSITSGAHTAPNRNGIAIEITTFTAAGTMRLTGDRYDPATGAVTGGFMEDIAVGATGWIRSANLWQGASVTISTPDTLDAVLDSHNFSPIEIVHGFTIETSEAFFTTTAAMNSLRVFLRLMEFPAGPTTLLDDTVAGLANGAIGHNLRTDLATAVPAGSSLLLQVDAQRLVDLRVRLAGDIDNA